MNYFLDTGVIILAIICTSYFSLTHASWNIGAFYFTQKTMKAVQLDPELMSERLPSSVQDRQQLCYYTKLHAKLLYIDHGYVPEWKKYVRDTEDIDSIHYGMYCATLPTTFLLVHSFEPFIQITFIESKVTDYVFDNNVFDVNSVRPRDVANLDTPFARLSDEDKRNLCVAAQEYIQMVFMDYNVEEGKVYEFSYGNTSESHFAFVCPGTPEVYIICPEPSVKKVKLIRHLRPVHLYEFELDELKASSVTPEPVGSHSLLASSTNTLKQLRANDRLVVCALARRFASLPFKDINVAEASWYTFLYPNLSRQTDVSLFCPVVPSVHLRSDNSSGKTRIKLTFLRNPFDEYHYESEFYSLIWRRYPNGNNKQEFGRMIEEFPLTALNEEERWQICSAAVARSVTFIVSLIPVHMISKMWKFSQLEDYEAEFPPSTQVALRCSLRPEIYLRMNRGDEKKIKVAFIREQYDTLANR